MGKLYAAGKDLLIHLTIDDIYAVRISKVQGGGFNYYGLYDPAYNNHIPIPKALAMDVIDAVKEGKVCDITYSFFTDNAFNFPGE